MLSPSLGRHVAHGAFENLEESLLNAFPGNVPGDADILSLAPDLIDLVYIDDSLLRFFHIKVGGLEKS